jgi:hypothetical protein
MQSLGGRVGPPCLLVSKRKAAVPRLSRLVGFLWLARFHHWCDERVLRVHVKRYDNHTTNCP